MMENQNRIFRDDRLPKDIPRFFFTKDTLALVGNSEFDTSRYRSAMIDLADSIFRFTILRKGDKLHIAYYTRMDGYEAGVLGAEHVADVHDDIFDGGNMPREAIIAIALLRLACNYIADNCTDEQLIRCGNARGGVLITAKDKQLESRIVFGKSRPDLNCADEKGNEHPSRPYADEQAFDLFSLFAGNSVFDMELDELIAAAEEDDEQALDRLYLAYLNGDGALGVEQDAAEAVKWLRKYAQTQSSAALFNMGMHYLKGFGVERDYRKAYEMMQAADECGDEDASAWMSKLEKIPETMAAAQSGDAQACADYARFLMEAARSLEQAGPGRDLEECVRYAQKAAAQNNGDGLWILGLAYEHGRGVRTDMQEAFQCYRRGAELGHGACQSSLAVMYMNGNPIPRDLKLGFEWTRKSALQGDQTGMYNLGRCYQFGHGTEASTPKAIEWYEKYLEGQPNEELERKVAILKDLEAQKRNAPAADPPLPEGYMEALKKAAGDFKVEDDTLVRYQGSDAKVRTPLLLKAIGRRAFVLNDALTEIEIAPKVQTIGEKAFMGCHRLQKLTLPQTLQEIHDFGFANCDRLEAVDFPAGMTVIGECAFINCTRLKSLVIPEGITEIPDNAFQNCSSLERVILPEGLKRIGREAFAECAMLKEINIPGTMTQTGPDAFRGCLRLEPLPQTAGQTASGAAEEPAVFFDLRSQRGGTDGCASARSGKMAQGAGRRRRADALLRKEQEKQKQERLWQYQQDCALRAVRERFSKQLEDSLSKAEKETEAKNHSAIKTAVAHSLSEQKRKQAQLEADLASTGFFAFSQKKELKQSMAQLSAQTAVLRVLAERIERCFTGHPFVKALISLCQNPDRQLTVDDMLDKQDSLAGIRLSPMLDLSVSDGVLIRSKTGNAAQYRLAVYPEPFRVFSVPTEEELHNQALFAVAEAEKLEVEGECTFDKVVDAVLRKIQAGEWKDYKPFFDAEECKEIIMDVVNLSGMTVSEIMQADSRLNGLSNMKVAALLRQLADEGRLERFEAGRKAYFRLP